MVNNAGILRDGTFHKMTFEDWDAVLKVHLYGGYNVIRAAWPHLREQRYGRIVVATSTSGLFGNFGQANYGAAKLGLVGLINTLAQEGAKYNIKANAVAPDRGHPDDQDILPPEVFEKLTPEYVAPVVAYLCTEEVSDTDVDLHRRRRQGTAPALFQNDGVTFAERALGGRRGRQVGRDHRSVGCEAGQVQGRLSAHEGACHAGAFGAIHPGHGSRGFRSFGTRRIGFRAGPAGRRSPCSAGSPNGWRWHRPMSCRRPMTTTTPQR